MTELRWTPDQECRLVGAVRHVAVHAVLHHRRVFPEEWTPLLSVAADAGLARRCREVEAIAVGAVGIVAVAADQLAVPQRVGGELQRIGRHIAVASRAGPVLFRRVAHRVDGVVDAVAVGAGEIGLFMGTAGPAGAAVVGMALQTESILQIRPGVRANAEVDDGLAFGAIGKKALVVFA